jgi:hypothetical protein
MTFKEEKTTMIGNITIAIAEERKLCAKKYLITANTKVYAW